MLITSVNNQTVIEWSKLKTTKYRNLTRTFLIEGEHLIEEAHKAGLILNLICLQEQTPLYSDYPVYYVSELVMKKISTNVSLNKHMALCRFIDTESVELSDRIVVLDRVQNPSNVGAIMRTALALGFDSIVLSYDSVDLYNEKLIKASQGAIFRIKTKKEILLDYIPKLKKTGYSILVTDLNTETQINDVLIPEKYVIIFGNEGEGVSDEVLKLSDKCLRIPISSIDSLNILSALSICLYELNKLVELRCI